jgi:hypothetical protein
VPGTTFLCVRLMQVKKEDCRNEYARKSVSGHGQHLPDREWKINDLRCLTLIGI